MKQIIFRRVKRYFTFLKGIIGAVLRLNIYVGRHLCSVPEGSLILFPCHGSLLCCGLAGIVSLKSKRRPEVDIDGSVLQDMVYEIETYTFDHCRQNKLELEQEYLGGRANLDALLNLVNSYKQPDVFLALFADRSILQELLDLAKRISALIATESEILSRQIGLLSSTAVESVSRSLETLKDIHWFIEHEIGENVIRTEKLISHQPIQKSPSSLRILREINAVLNSIDRLEVRGRDSAGISILLIYNAAQMDTLKQQLDQADLADIFQERSCLNVLSNQSICIGPDPDGTDSSPCALVFTYKIAAEIGSLGDNVAFLRRQITEDPIFQRAVTLTPQNYTILSHTRWASVGAITEANCHPVDNVPADVDMPKKSVIHACLNGDIDNYLDLKEDLAKDGIVIQSDISTDTKIIPLQIEKHLKRGVDPEEAFRLALNDFKGSHAISMHTDLAPGKLFLAQRGSGQAIFVGLADDHYMPASEVYGFIEETAYYLKLDGEKIIPGEHGDVQGQIFILDQASSGGVSGIKAMYYDGSPLKLGEDDIKQTAITSRDIDRQHYPHYFMKEISESPLSVEKTLQNRWKITDQAKEIYSTSLDSSVLTDGLIKAISDKQIRKIVFIGQGTAGVAAQACADIMSYYLDDPRLVISALKASELSGSKLNDQDSAQSLSDTLVIAISQSGTTTDTNRTVDMVKERGAATLAIVNRRDSDITFKVDGVLYTSTGRDIEMSVASTKAFYSQIVAGAVLGLHLASITGRRSAEFVTTEIKQLLELPSHMRKILAMQEPIKLSAQKLAATKTYWAAVGSGPNKASADEIRIKLSELCYKTISSDFVEDKKHIDLSSEPLIIVCAAGSKETVLGDVIKDTAIFKAHKATPVVIANMGETRFDTYAEDVFHVPVVSEHLAPIVNTLVGHIWGYYAALAINEGSKFLHSFRQEIQKTIEQQAQQDHDVYEVLLDKSFREKITLFYKAFREKKLAQRFPVSIAMASDLTLLLKYLSGRLPGSDFELDFGLKGTASNMLNTFFKFMGESINYMSRPIDAIKHQAKTVTVGTSRIGEKVEGLLFNSLTEHGINIAQLVPHNVIVLRNIQEIVAGIEGSILYRISNLNLLGEPIAETRIEVLEKKGVLEPIPSRIETDTILKGTKRIIVRKGNVYIGKGRKDGRSILVIPIISTSSLGPGTIENLLLLNISFRQAVPLQVIIKALGGKYEHIKNIVQENSIPWDDTYLDRVDMDELFGRSAEKIGERIISDLLEDIHQDPSDSGK